MKTNFSKKLSLNKKTIADLEMNEAQGGLEGPLEPEPTDAGAECKTRTECMTQCPSNDTLPLACCVLC